MKQKNIKILMAIIAIILVVGAVIIFTKGMAFELRYQDSKRIEVNLGKEFEKKDIKNITKEVLGKQPVIIQPIEVYKDAVSITTTEITEEQKADLVTKLNEKYETELVADEIKIEEVAHIRGRDIIKPYIAPFAIATVIILAYFAIRYNRISAIKVVAEAVGVIVLAQLVLLAIMAITRMPIGMFTIPAVLVVYMLSNYICVEMFDKKLDNISDKSKNR